MSMGRRQRRQEPLFVATADLARSAGHPFYRKLNELLAEAEFDRWIEGRCDVTKRYLIAAAAHYLGRILRTLFGIGNPKALQDLRALAVFAQIFATMLRITTASVDDRFIVSFKCFAIPYPRTPKS